MTALQAARNLFRIFTSTTGFDSTVKQVIASSVIMSFSVQHKRNNDPALWLLKHNISREISRKTGALNKKRITFICA